MHAIQCHPNLAPSDQTQSTYLLMVLLSSSFGCLGSHRSSGRGIRTLTRAGSMAPSRPRHSAHLGMKGGKTRIRAQAEARVEGEGKHKQGHQHVGGVNSGQRAQALSTTGDAGHRWQTGASRGIRRGSCPGMAAPWYEQGGLRHPAEASPGTWLA